MNPFSSALHRLPPYLLASVAGALTVAQVVLALVLPGPRSETLAWIGWICLWASAPFGLLPIWILRTRGGVARGESYIRTTTLVETGLYAVVRHPQNGTAWLLINLGLALVTQHPSSAVLGALSMALAYLDTFKADRRCVEKFGPPYQEYQRRVPRVNFFWGLVRLLAHKIEARRATHVGGER